MRKALKYSAFWLLTLTWGAVMSCVSLCVFLYEWVVGNKPHFYHGEVYFYVKGDWGANLGWVFLVPDDSMREHESGHGIQNALYGPFAVFLVYVPSVFNAIMCRFVYKNNDSHNKLWFEGQATEFGAWWTKDLSK